MICQSGRGHSTGRRVELSDKHRNGESRQGLTLSPTPLTPPRFRGSFM